MVVSERTDNPLSISAVKVQISPLLNVSQSNHFRISCRLKIGSNILGSIIKNVALHSQGKHNMLRLNDFCKHGMLTPTKGSAANFSNALQAAARRRMGLRKRRQGICLLDPVGAATFRPRFFSFFKTSRPAVQLRILKYQNLSWS